MIHIGKIIVFEKFSIINLKSRLGEFNIMRTLKLVLPIALAVFLIFTTFQPEASTYYVDKSNPNASDNNPGTENEPWATIQKGIDVAQAGDTVFIKGGTYTPNGLKMKRSGAVGNPIVFKNYDNNSVVIDMSSAPDRGWDWDGYKDYLIIDGLTFINGKWPVLIKGSYNEIRNCELYGAIGTVINVWGGSYNLISNNKIHDYGYNGVSIESRPNDGNLGRADSNIVEYNHIYNSSGHMGVNIFPNTGQAQELMYFNIIRWNKIHDIYSSGIYLRRQVNAEIYGNLIYNAGMWGIFFHWRSSSDGAHVSDVKVYNNTIVNSGYDGIDNHSHKNIDLKNNLIFDTNNPEFALDFSTTVGTSEHDIDYNLYYQASAGEKVTAWNSKSLKYTLSEEQSNLGYDLNSYDTNPLFSDLGNDDYTLQAGSDAIDNGVNLGPPYNKDLNGNIRGADGQWDIGAYETILGPDVYPPELIDASLSDSVTLKLTFSELIDPTSTQDINNYSISNGISVLSVSSSGSAITLSTSIHSPGIYFVTVNNVTDLAGNLISQDHNSAQYEMLEDPAEGLKQFSIVEVTASVIPEPEHSPDKTIDGIGYDDGDPDSRWAGQPMPEWLMFDLGTVKLVGMTKLSFYNLDSGRIYNYNIEVSTDLNQWQEIITNATSSTEEWSVEEFDAVDARYIKVVFINSNQNDWAGLWEGQIWGFVLTNVKDDAEPNGFKLEQNYPNPFNPSTTIRYTLVESQKVILNIYDTLGQLVSELVNEFQSNGVHEIVFYAEDLASGIYIYRLQTESRSDVGKMILQR